MDADFVMIWSQAGLNLWPADQSNRQIRLMQKLSMLLLLVILIAASCSKNSTNNNGPILWPLKAGNTWVYQDSVFSSTGLDSVYLDTATFTSKTLTDANGVYYANIQEPNGWFGTGGYIGVDAGNTTIFEWDSLSNGPYIFFQTVLFDGTFIGSGIDDSDPNCPKQGAQYGYATPASIAGYNCLINVEYTTDCNNITKEAVVTYVSPGVGVVRMEDYMADSTNTLYLDYSQTLHSDKLLP
jgi:hypothetical protein